MKRLNRRTVTVSALAFAIASALATPVWAQNDTAQNNTGQQQQEATTLKAIEVTGTRIKGSQMATQTPTITITGAEIRDTGLTSVGAVLQQLTTSGSALNLQFNSAGNFGFPPDGSGVGSGSTTVDLRNLGAKRVLVLVDGLRWVNESSASGVSGAVDLNTIPVGAIQRIEILKNGASALYGADAIAGVINIITKRSQKGGHASVYFGDHTDLNGGTKRSVDLSFGGRGDKFEYFLDFNYVKVAAISSSAWARSSECVPGTGLANCSSAADTGRFIFTDPSGVTHDVTANGTIQGKPEFPQDYHSFTNDDRYNYATSNLLLTPSDRKSIFGHTRYSLTDNIAWYTRAMYTHRTSLNRAAPGPIFLGPAGANGAISDATGVDVTNPYNPFGFTLNPDVATGNEQLVARRPVEGGPRLYSQDVNTYYFATGLKGAFSIGAHDLFWDVNFAYGDNQASQIVNGTYNIAHIRRALGPIDQCRADLGCVPLNLFGGPGTITPAMLKYIGYQEHDRSGNKIHLWTANISGPLFDLPAGPFAFAAGFAHRNYSGFYQPGAVVVAGDSNGVPSLPISGKYHVNALYLELNVPLLHDLPAVKSLDLSVASRHADYSTFGTTTKSKAGLRWQVDTDLMLRGTWSQGFRAPTIGELFGSPARFDATLQDPCTAPIADPTTAANCASLGIPASYQQRGPQISVITGGNQNLQPEISHSINLGAVYSPIWATNMAWSKSLDITLGYYHVKIKGTIQASDAQTVLDRCVATGDANSHACAPITRNVRGTISDFQDTLQNLGRLTTEGYELGVDWRSPEYAVGQFQAHWQNTFVKNFQVRQPNGKLQPRRVGIELTNSAIPRLQSNLNMNWKHGNWNINYRLRFFSSLIEDCGGAGGFPICSNPDEVTPNRPNGTNQLSSVVYNAIRATWKVPLPSWNMTLSAGINNLFNKKPPVCLSCSLNGYDASTYLLPSRFAYVQAAFDF